MRPLSILGPGLLMAGAAIGVSHLVQSTRAGAGWGYQLVLVVLAVNLFKYPFFEYGHRYAVARGENLIAGYRRMGRGYVYAFLAISVLSAVSGIAGVTFVTAGLAEHLFGAFLGTAGWSVVIMAVCFAILALGRYRWLDGGMKVIMAVLVVATVTAFVVAAGNGPVAPDAVPPPVWTFANLAFLLALMGWMPAPIDVSVWQSLWMEARDQERGRRTSMRDALIDFNVSYGLTVVMAVLFLALGALLMHGTGVEIPEASGAFAALFVDMYQRTLGAWSAPIIGAAALTTMFSTVLTVIDAYPRSLAVSMQLALPSLRVGFQPLYLGWIIVGCAASLLIILSFLDRLTGLVDFATILAFLAGPLYAILNFRLITSVHTPPEFRPGITLIALSWLGLAFGIGFCVLYLVYRMAPSLLV